MPQLQFLGLIFSANLRYKRVPVVGRVGNTILWINHYSTSMEFDRLGGM